MLTVTLQCINEVVHVVHIINFYAKVIYHKTESDVLPDVLPETRCVLAMVVHFGGIFQVVDLQGCWLGEDLMM
jgi:hypothetical protein